MCHEIWDSCKFQFLQLLLHFAESLSIKPYRQLCHQEDLDKCVKNAPSCAFEYFVIEA